MTKHWTAIAPIILLTGCATQTVSYPTKPKIKLDMPSRLPIPKIGNATTTATGLDAVIGKEKSALIQMFGPPRLDIIEVKGRKLQFAGQQCVLDAYLYPEGRNNAEIVTHVDARRSDGAEVDRGQCITALQAR
jgi:hypothetical protein